MTLASITSHGRIAETKKNKVWDEDEDVEYDDGNFLEEDSFRIERWWPTSYSGDFPRWPTSCEVILNIEELNQIRRTENQTETIL